MKFSVSSSELLKKLSISSGVISTNPVLPILEDFLFTISQNKLTISSTNLETFIITSLEVVADEDGSIAIPAKILLDTLKALPDQPISFSINEKTNGIKITSTYGEYKLAGDSQEDFPEIPENEDTDNINISSEILISSISKTLFATSTDELRIAMTGVFVQIDFNKLIFVATDAHKLVKYSFDNIKSDVTTSFIVPNKAMSLLKNALIPNTIVNLAFNKTNVFFSFDDTQVICRLVDAKYPDYNAVIPIDNSNVLSLGRLEIQNALRRIAIYANKTTNQVIFNLNEGSLTITAQDLDFSNEATEQLSCNYSGESMTIGFNAKFLIEMLSVLESDNIRIELSTPKRAGILFPSDENENESLLMLVMPVMMSN